MSYSHGAFFAGGIAGGKATLAGERGGKFGLANAVILEIDATILDCTLCYPDEDYLEQQGRLSNDGISGDIVKRTAYYRENMLKSDRWEECFNTVGSTAYRGIVPVSAIKRMTTIDWDSFDPKMLWDIYRLYLEGSVPSPILYPYQGMTQKELTELFFGDKTHVNGGRIRLNKSVFNVVRNRMYKKRKLQSRT
jgi:hypothetical protein